MTLRSPTLAHHAWLFALILALAPARGASLSGVVLENGTGRALARAQVRLQVRGAGGSSSASSGRVVRNGGTSPALSDGESQSESASAARAAQSLQQLAGSRGEFSFTGLPAGIYFLRAERKGYAAVEYGQKSFEEPGTPIVLSEGSDFSAVLRLPRLGVIAGTVVDENQVGLENVPVQAYRLGQTWRAAAAADTDDRGAYRLAGLRPGRYVVRTSARQIDGGIGLLPTYYGQTVRAKDAQTVEVRLDQEVDSVDIAPDAGRLARVTGRLVGASAAEVILLTEAGPRRTRIREAARFDFGQTEPGQYALLVEPSAAGGSLAALAEVTVGSADLDVAIAMQAAPRLTIECASADGAAVDARGVAIFVRRPDFGENSERLACGEQKIWGPGDWEIAVSTPPQYYVEAILETDAGEDARRFLAAPGHHRRITVLLHGDPATLTGTVTLGGEPVVGAPVFLNAVSEELRGRSGGIRSTRADARGSYSFVGLPPGRYGVVSSYQLRNVEQDGWPDGLGTFVDVRLNEESVQNLTLTEIR